VQTADRSTAGIADEIEVTPEAPRSWEPPAWLLLTIFTIVAVLLTFPNLGKFGTHIGGDSGDSILNLRLMRWDQIALPHGWHGLWSPPVFYPTRNTFAYSDTLLSVALVHWPLRTIFGDVVAFNLISVAAWVLSSWCTYRLARRFVSWWGAAFVAAFAYTYAAVRLIHQQHFQLVVGGAVVPLVLLCLLRLLDRPSPRRGIAVGLSFAFVTLTASYFGAMLGVIILVVALGWLLTLPKGKRKPTVIALLTAAGVIAVLVGPVGIQYVKLQQHSEFRRGFEPASAAHLDDFLSAGSNNYLLEHVPVIAPRSKVTSRGIENRLFPGFVASIFGIAGAVLVARQFRRRRMLALIGIAGVACLVLAFGDWFRVGGHRIFLPFVVFRHLVPGFSGIRAVSRFTVGFQLALALFAAVGLDALLRRVRSTRTRTVVAVGLAAFVCLESAIGLVFVKVPTTKDDGGVAQALESRPKGVAVELPIKQLKDGSLWAYAESSRQLLALQDHDPRVNGGYSGFQPPGFPEKATTLNHFPAPDALAQAHQLGVRYVVLRTSLVGPLTPSVLTKPVSKDGAGRYTDATAQRMIAALPPGAATEVAKLPGGYLVTLAP
jgi:hypothetical protein